VLLAKKDTDEVADNHGENGIIDYICNLMYVNSDFVNIGAFIVYFDQGNNIYRIHKALAIAILPFQDNIE
jgi:hypothetical protein